MTVLFCGWASYLLLTQGIRRRSTYRLYFKGHTAQFSLAVLNWSNALNPTPLETTNRGRSSAPSPQRPLFRPNHRSRPGVGRGDRGGPRREKPGETDLINPEWPPPRYGGICRERINGRGDKDKPTKEHGRWSFCWLCRPGRQGAEDHLFLSGAVH